MDEFLWPRERGEPSWQCQARWKELLEPSFKNETLVDYRALADEFKAFRVDIFGEGPDYENCLSYTFYLQKNEISVEEYRAGIF